jgi:3-hydroxymyristoyl/3-hydroxydecanoyl-(acyl carrier protein) dehydratase
MIDIQLNSDTSIKVINIGNENYPLLLIDNFANNAENLITLAGNGEHFCQQDQDFYPGVRQNMPATYGSQICALHGQLIKFYLGLEHTKKANTVLSALSITTTPPERLKPIQMVPHFDSTSNQQIAVIHYLCDDSHGGTSFYRHKQTGLERITEQQLPQYSQLLKQQAIAEKLHLNSQYISSETSLYEKIHTVKAKMNRAIIYPSNALHSGDIQRAKKLSANPKQGRLTISSFIYFE